VLGEQVEGQVGEVLGEQVKGEAGGQAGGEVAGQKSPKVRCMATLAASPVVHKVVLATRMAICRMESRMCSNSHKDGSRPSTTTCSISVGCN
jgi:hypothetical protein